MIKFYKSNFISYKAMALGGGTFTIGIWISIIAGYLFYYILNKHREKKHCDQISLLDTSILEIPEKKLEKIIKKIKSKLILYLASFFEKSFHHIQQKNQSNEKIIISPSNSFKEILNCKYLLKIAELMRNTLFKKEIEVVNEFGFEKDQYLHSLKIILKANE